MKLSLQKRRQKIDPSCVLWLDTNNSLPTGTSIRDISGYNNNGIITGATWVRLSSGEWVNNFDATDDWISCGTGTSLNFTASDFTIKFWFYANTLVPANQDLICHGLFNADGYRIRIDNAGKVYFATYQSGAGQTTNTGAVSAGKWYQFIGTRKGTTVDTYINGVLNEDVSGVHTNPLTASRNLYIGRYDDDATKYIFSGRIGRVRILNRYCSAIEASSIFISERYLFGV